MRKILLVTLIFSCFFMTANSQCTHKHSTLDSRIETSELIVEGSVVDQRSFVSSRNGIIYTSQTIEIFKILKGHLSAATINVVTTGGKVGTEKLEVYPSLSLSKNETGIFFLRNDRRKFAEIDKTWQPVAVQSSFVKYNPELSAAIDMDQRFEDLDHLYEIIEQRTGTPANSIKALPLVASSRNPIAPAITGIAPLTVKAGMTDEITITGTGFGTSVGFVLFKDPDTGGATETAVQPIASDWTDSSIKVTVPSKAGTGEIRIQTATSQFSPESAQVLDVEFALANTSSGDLKYLVDHLADGDGGYKLQYSTSTANNGVSFTSVFGATDAFERALDSWHAASGLNVYTGTDCGTVTVNVPLSDGQNIVSFDSDAYDLDTEHSSSTLAVAFTWTSQLSGGGQSTENEIIGMDIIFRRDQTNGGGAPAGFVNWNFSAGSPGVGETDFESVALHEIGHLSGLGHVIDAPEVMHYQIVTGTEKRSLGVNDAAGSTTVVNYSILYNPPNFPFPFANFPNDRQASAYDAANECSTAAPVELTGFTGVLNEAGRVDLEWHTSLEFENDYFTLERSKNAVDFQVIARVDGAGNSDVSKAYVFQDKDALPGLSYYRLSQTDYNGTMKTHNQLVTIDNRKIVEVEVVPNPVVDDNVSIKYDAIKTGEVNITIRSFSGALLYKGVKEVNKGTNIIDITAYEIPAGIYYIRTQQNEISKTLKFMRSRF